MTPQGCSVWDKVKCAGTITACGVACGFGALLPTPQCILCMGSAYDRCKDCF